MAVVAQPGFPMTAVIVMLDRDRLRSEFIEPQVAKYFGAGDRSEYVVTVARQDRPGEIVYASDPHTIVENPHAHPAMIMSTESQEPS